MRLPLVLGFIFLASFGASAETESQRSSLVEMNKILFWACKHYQNMSVSEGKLRPLRTILELQEYSSSTSALAFLDEQEYYTSHVSPGELTVEDLIDDWDSRYHVDFSYSNAEIFVTSFGADKKEGGVGLDGDFAVRLDLNGPLAWGGNRITLCHDLEYIIEFDIISRVDLEYLFSEYEWSFLDFYQY
jgi:hypothetical protein